MTYFDVMSISCKRLRNDSYASAKASAPLKAFPVLPEAMDFPRSSPAKPEKQNKCGSNGSVIPIFPKGEPKANKTAPSFPISTPFDTVYRKDSPACPVGPHSHNGAELYLTLSDLPDVLLNDTVSEVPAGTLILIPPFCIHQLYHKAGTVYERYILSIHSQWLETVFCRRSDALPYLKQGAAPLLLPLGTAGREPVFHRMKELQTLSGDFSPHALSVFFCFLSALDAAVTGLAPMDSRTLPISAQQKSINEVIAYIHEHIHDHLTVTGLAEQFYLHPDYLSRLFKRHVHSTISHYITVQKIATAQSLLRDGCTVAQVQEALGFSSYAYFFRTFQKCTGISPSRYRAQYCRELHSSSQLSLEVSIQESASCGNSRDAGEKLCPGTR